MSYGELMLIEKLEAEKAELRRNLNRTDAQLRESLELEDFYRGKLEQVKHELAEYKRKYEPELEYARDLGRCGI